MERECTKCHQSKELTKENFYKWSRGFARKCKACYQKDSRDYQCENGYSHSRNRRVDVLGRNLIVQRHIPKEFIKYMTANPFYFEYAFKLPATQENIQAESKKL
jgi:hypothetical protein